MSLTFGFLNGLYTASQFAEVHFEVFGNGICSYGGQMKVTARGSNGVSVAPGYALIGGYWLKNTVSTSLYIAHGETVGGRYDAVVLRVDLQTRTVDIILEQGIASDNPTAYYPIRNESYYEMILAYIYVAPATTMISENNITDTRANDNLCGIIELTSELGKKILEVYHFAMSSFQSMYSSLAASAEKANGKIRGNIQGLQFDEAAFESVESHLSTLESSFDHESLSAFLSQFEETLAGVDSLQAAWDKLTELDSAKREIEDVTYKIGDLLTTVSEPEQTSKWLLCDGSSIPEVYHALSAVLDGTLPEIRSSDNRLSTWIYAGSPTL